MTRYNAANPRNDLTAEYLRSILDYDPDIGIFRWKIRVPGKGGMIEIGDIAGNTCADRGYVRIGIDGHTYYAHRLAYLWMTGEWPSTLIDHRNHSTDDNRWSEIRPATHANNVHNRRIDPRNTSGAKGVSTYFLAGGRTIYRAWIGINRKSIYIGTFDTLAQASAAYDAKAMELFGEFANTNRHGSNPTIPIADLTRI